MKLVKKMVFFLLIGIIAAGALVACRRQTSTATQERTVISIWTHNRHDLVFMQEKVNRYNETNTDNFFIDLGVYTDNYVQAINLAFTAGEGPDMTSNQIDIFPLHLPQGRWADIGPLMDNAARELFKDNIWDNVNMYDGKIYFIPPFATTSRVFYNIGIFRRLGIQPPTTKEEMVAAARQITQELRGEGIYGFSQNMRNAQAGLGRSLDFQINRQLGIHQGYDFRRGVYDFTGYAPMLAAWRELLSDAIAFPGTESLDIDPLRAQFANGNIAMYISWINAEPGVYESQFPTTEEWGAIENPILGGNVIGAQNFNSIGGWLTNSASSVVRESWKVQADLLLSVELLAEYYEQGLGIATVPEVLRIAQPAPVFRDNPAMQIGPTDVQWPRPPHLLNSTAVIVEGPNMHNTFAQILYTNVDPVRTLQDLTERYNRAYDIGIQQGLITRIINPNLDPMRPSL